MIYNGIIFLLNLKEFLNFFKKGKFDFMKLINHFLTLVFELQSFGFFSGQIINFNNVNNSNDMSLCSQSYSEESDCSIVESELNDDKRLTLKIDDKYSLVSALINGQNIINYEFKNNDFVLGIEPIEQLSTLEIELKEKKPNLLQSFLLESKSNANSSTLKKKLFLYSDGNSIFTSPISMDSAIQNAGKNPTLINNPLTINPFIPIIPIEKEYGSKILWKDNNGNTFPLVGAEVQIKWSMKGSFVSSTTVYTDENGNFNTGIPISDTYEISGAIVYPQNDYVLVTTKDAKLTDDFNSEYGISLDTSALSNSNTFIISSKVNGIESDKGAAFQIFQALFYYSKYAKELSSDKDLEKCIALYPYDASTGMSYSYINGVGNIRIPYYNQNEIASYESWDTIGHEYGHHIGKTFNTCIYNGIGYAHYVNNDDLRSVLYQMNSDAENDKKIEAGLALAWSESWPTYWAEIAEHSFPDDIKNDYCYGYVGDEIYEAFNFNKNYYYHLDNGENFTDLYNSIDELFYIGGEAYEVGIIRFLYEINRKLDDQSLNEDSDSFDDGVIYTDCLWPLVIDCGKQFLKQSSSKVESQTFSSFYTYLFDLMKETGEYKSLTMRDLSSIASNYWIAPSLIKAKGYSSQVIISWQSSGFYHLTNESLISLGMFDSNGAFLGMVDYKSYLANNPSIEISNNELTTLKFMVNDNQECSLALMLSPHRYKIEESSYLTGPYVKIIWSGTRDTLILPNLLNIN